MDNYDDRDVYVCPELGIDSDLKSFLDKGAALVTLQCYHHWRRGYDGTDIGSYFKISAEEAESHIELARRLLPVDIVESDIKLRDEITRPRIRTEGAERGWLKDSELSAQMMLRRGRNPGNVLKRLREELTADIPSRIASLRQKDLDIGRVDEKEAGLALVKDNKLIKALRERDKKPAKEIMAQKQWEERAHMPLYLGENRPVQKAPDKKESGKKAGRRISFRLDDRLYEQIQRRSHEIGIDLSAIIRRAIVQHLDGESTSKDGVMAEMPAEALARVGKYQAWGSDLREKLRESFLQLVAMAFATSHRWTRTLWVKQLFLALLPLYRYLEADRVRQD